MEGTHRSPTESFRQLFSSDWEGRLAIVEVFQLGFSVFVCAFHPEICKSFLFLFLFLYCLPNIVRVTKSRRLRWAGHVARMQKGRSAFKILTDKPTGNKFLGRFRRLIRGQSWN